MKKQERTQFLSCFLYAADSILNAHPAKLLGVGGASNSIRQILISSTPSPNAGLGCAARRAFCLRTVQRANATRNDTFFRRASAISRPGVSFCILFLTRQKKYARGATVPEPQCPPHLLYARKPPPGGAAVCVSMGHGGRSAHGVAQKTRDVVGGDAKH